MKGPSGYTCIAGVKFTLNFTRVLSKSLVKAVPPQQRTTHRSSLHQPSSLSTAQWGGACCKDRTSHWSFAGEPCRRTQHTTPYAKLACLVQNYPCTAEGSDFGRPSGADCGVPWLRMWQFLYKQVFSIGLMHVLSCRTDQLQAPGNQSFCLDAKMAWVHVDLRKMPAGQVLCQPLFLRRLCIPSLTDLPTVLLKRARNPDVTPTMCHSTAQHCGKPSESSTVLHIHREAMSRHSQNIANHRPGLPALSGNKE